VWATLRGDAVADPIGCDPPGAALANRAAARLIQEPEAQAKPASPGQRDGSVGKNDSEISAVIFGF
jgi:hypothetical protein